MKSGKFAVFYHLHVNEPESWQTMYQAQMGALWLTGVADAAQDVFICINGDMDQVAGPPNAICTQNPPSQEETPTLRKLHAWCLDNPDAGVLYFHSKGTSHLGTQRHTFVEDWRLNMEYFVLHNWEECIDYLEEGYDAVGINWQTETGYGDQPHFSGGFWWANSNYIASLGTEYLDHPVRYYREFWIGSGNPKVKNLWESGMNVLGDAKHYHKHYSKSNYTDNYLNGGLPDLEVVS